MSFNIRYENLEDGEHIWQNRKGAVVEMLNTVRPDVFGVQEALVSQVDYLDSAMVDYSFVGVGRDDGVCAGEYAAIYYRTDMFDVVADGHFWLSETPNVPGLGWDAVCTRIATWAKLKIKASGKEFLVMNTHFDHVGLAARNNSGLLILNKIEELGGDVPAVLMGDFNSVVTDEALKPILASMTEVYAAVEDKDATSDTFIGFSPKNVKGQIIDHIFCNAGFKPTYYKIITDTYGLPQLSDHRPVLCKLAFE